MYKQDPVMGLLFQIPSACDRTELGVRINTLQGGSHENHLCIHSKETGES